MKAKIIPSKRYKALGCAWSGNPTRRAGRLVECGHRHKSRKAAEKCLKKMKKERPGKCQTYRIFSIIYIPVSKA